MKKSFSMFMTLAVISIFSFIVVLGLRISALQLDEKKYLPRIAKMTYMADSMSYVIGRIISKKKSCKKSIYIKNDGFDIKGHISYIPECDINDGNVTSFLLDINLKIIDNEYNIAFNKQYYRYTNQR